MVQQYVLHNIQEALRRDKIATISIVPKNNDLRKRLLYRLRAAQHRPFARRNSSRQYLVQYLVPFQRFPQRHVGRRPSQQEECVHSQAKENVTDVTTCHILTRAACDATKDPLFAASWGLVGDFRAQIVGVDTRADLCKV